VPTGHGLGIEVDQQRVIELMKRSQSMRRANGSNPDDG
jgi:hypothetical protein